ncbi:MAG TPA: hypothetical protein PLO16_14975 [Acidocella sp.]|nr:hypothetical protein [Acidocella sp.]
MNNAEIIKGDRVIWRQDSDEWVVIRVESGGTVHMARFDDRDREHRAFTIPAMLIKIVTRIRA